MQATVADGSSSDITKVKALQRVPLLCGRVVDDADDVV